MIVGDNKHHTYNEKSDTGKVIVAHFVYRSVKQILCFRCLMHFIPFKQIAAPPATQFLDAINSISRFCTVCGMIMVVKLLAKIYPLESSSSM